jgi:hypothetical protein
MYPKAQPRRRSDLADKIDRLNAHHPLNDGSRGQEWSPPVGLASVTQR